MRRLNRSFVLFAVTTAVLSLSVAGSNAEQPVAGIGPTGPAATAYPADVWQQDLLTVPLTPTPAPDTKPKCPPPLRCPAKQAED
jgi:hypothetical protein